MLLALRSLLVVTPLAILACRAARPVWSSAPVGGDAVPDHPLVWVTFVLVVVFAIALPWVVVPLGPVGAARIDEGALEVATVVGVRRVDVRTARLTALWLPGRVWNVWLYVLRDGRRRGSVLLAHLGGQSFPADIRDVLKGVAADPARASTAARVALGVGPVPLRTSIGVHVAGLLVLVLVACGSLLLIGVLLTLAGLS